MFIDRVKVSLKAGKGGDGLVSYRREKYVPLGGPYGGDGGDGGNIVFVADTNKSTLLDLRFQRHISAESGENGKNKKMHGARGEDTLIYVPVGTMIKDVKTNRLLADLIEDKQAVVVAKGGVGGRGNTRFKTPRNPAPDFAEKGAMGEGLEVLIELKLLADVGLIGFPSVGKSTFLSVVSAARPEIAPYPFTTIVPNLGVVQVDEKRSFVLADMPGIIEGAALGKGLGIQFLRHIERTKVLIHILDMGAEDGRDPIEDYKIINEELRQYVVDLSDRPQIVVANKMDLDNAKSNLERFKKAFPEVDVNPVMAIIKDGVQLVLYKAMELLEEMREVQPLPSTETFVYSYVPEPPKFEVTKLGNNRFRLTGDPLLAKYRQSTLDTQEGVQRFAYILKRWGVDEALRKAGAVDGDIIAIDDVTFVFVEE